MTGIFLTNTTPWRIKPTPIGHGPYPVLFNTQKLPPPPPPPTTTTATTTITIPCHEKKLGFFHRFFIGIRWDVCLGKSLFIWLQKSRKTHTTPRNNTSRVLTWPIYVTFCHD